MLDFPNLWNSFLYFSNESWKNNSRINSHSTNNKITSISNNSLVYKSEGLRSVNWRLLIRKPHFIVSNNLTHLTAIRSQLQSNYISQCRSRAMPEQHWKHRINTSYRNINDWSLSIKIDYIIPPKSFPLFTAKKVYANRWRLHSYGFTGLNCCHSIIVWKPRMDHNHKSNKWIQRHVVLCHHRTHQLRKCH